MKKEEKLFSFKKLGRLLLFVYLFILSIEIIKKASILLAPNIKNLISDGIPAIKAISVGWFITSIVQSSGAVSSITAAFAGNNLLSLSTVVYILLGTILGTTITALIISFITTTKKRRDFRHGFEIGLCFAIYSGLIVIIVFLLEYFFKFFSRLSLYLATLFKDKITFLNIPDLVSIITSPITNPIFEKNHSLFLLILGFAILIIALKYMGRVVIDFFGGEKEARKFINKHFKSKYKAYLIGLLLTAILFSSSITIGLLVPLTVARLINLKKAIPFILGAKLGTFTDVFLASLIIGKIPAIATAIAYFLFAFIGSLIFLPNTNFLFKITKYISKKVIHISRKKALYFLLAFIAIPLLIIIL